MMKSGEKLIASAKLGREKTIGNHSLKIAFNSWFFYYHNTAICIYNTVTKVVQYKNGGWNTTSTNRAINSYKEYFGKSTSPDSL